LFRGARAVAVGVIAVAGALATQVGSGGGQLPRAVIREGLPFIAAGGEAADGGVPVSPLRADPAGGVVAVGEGD
jgi:hypothetical protein